MEKEGTGASSFGRGSPFSSPTSKKKNKGSHKRYRKNLLKKIAFSQSIPEKLGHPLENKWTFWYYSPDQQSRSWEDQLKQISTVATIEQFWSVYNWTQRPSSLRIRAGYCLFKVGITPAWEHSANKDGGRWTVSCGKEEMDSYWKELIVAMVGLQFGVAEDKVLNGAVTTINNRGSKVSLWVSESGSKKIGEEMNTLLNLKTNVMFREHNSKANVDRPVVAQLVEGIQKMELSPGGKLQARGEMSRVFGSMDIREKNKKKPVVDCAKEEASVIDGLKVLGIKSSCSPHWSVGTSCIARWSEDGVWYNAVVDSGIVPQGQCQVTFTDYGNTDTVAADSIVTTAADIPGDQLDMVDEYVHLPDEQQSLPGSPDDMTDPEELLPGAEVDPHVKTASPKQPQLKFLFLPSPGSAGLEAKQRLVITDLKGPVGLTMLVDKSLAVVCRGDGSVRRFSYEGEFLGVVTGQRHFVRPTDILLLRSGEFVVRDELGIQMFQAQGMFIKNLGESFLNSCYGLAEDELGRIVTINCKTGRGADLTDLGQTDVVYIDRESGDFVKREKIIGIVEEGGSPQSACRFLTYNKEKLYVVDMGLDCVYVLSLKNGDKQAEMFGSTGDQDGQFRSPAGLIVDSSGTMIVVDSNNHRLQMVDTNYSYCGDVQVVNKSIMLTSTHTSFCFI